MSRYLTQAIAMAVIICAAASATVINIPDDYSTIQAGIDASTDGDTVLVQPGTYVENVNFNGHNIVLGSLFLTTGDTSFIAQTTIDAHYSGSVLTFENGEDSTTYVIGFEIVDGNAEYGGGIYCLESNPRIANNRIHGNSATTGGGGIYTESCSPMICENNISGNGGGGVFCNSYSSPTIRSNFIHSNLDGGIRCWYNSSSLIDSNVIMNNTASQEGGGILCAQYSDATIQYNLIVGNSSRGGSTSLGGGIYCYYSSAVLVNNTFSRNYAGLSGGGFCCYYCQPIIYNTIFWEDSSEFDNEIAFMLYEPVVTYCAIEGGWDGEGNIDADPLFVNENGGDYHLLAGSPCIDAGHPYSPPDPDSTSADIGAFYFDQTVAIDDTALLDVRYALSENYPNPFNVSTRIPYTLPQPSRATVEIYNLLGQRIITLFDNIQQAGRHNIIWDASGYPSGVYFARLRMLNRTESIKMLLLK